MNLYRILEGNFPRQGGDWALEVPEVGRYSWADLQQGSAMLAHLLNQSTSGSGARVLCQVEKSVEALMLYLACLRAGLVYVPLNTAYRDAEVEYFLRDTEPEVVIVSPERFGRLSSLAFSAGARHVYTLSDKRTGSLLERAACQPRDFSTVDRADNDLAALLYTSGTTGRSKDLIISGGYNVYPKEIEDELNALAYIEESAVIGVPHPDFGEAVVAIVVARPGFSEREALKSLRQRLANYKCPKHIMTATALPRNAMGKLQKNALREQYGKIFANV